MKCFITDFNIWMVWPCLGWLMKTRQCHKHLQISMSLSIAHWLQKKSPPWYTMSWLVSTVSVNINGYTLENSLLLLCISYCSDHTRSNVYPQEHNILETAIKIGYIQALHQLVLERETQMKLNIHHSYLNGPFSLTPTFSSWILQFFEHPLWVCSDRDAVDPSQSSMLPIQLPIIGPIQGPMLIWQI